MRTTFLAPFTWRMGLFSSSAARLPAGLRAPIPSVATWVQWLARLGYAARGVVYLLVGGIAVQAARSATHRPEDSSAALLVIHRQPFGRLLLAIIAVGLAGFVMWRLVQAIRDPEREGTDAKGLMKRGGYAISGLIHAGLALEAVRLLAGGFRPGGAADRTDHWTAMAMAQPAGRWLVAATGIVIVIVGLNELYRAYAADVREGMDLTRLRGPTRDRVVRFGRFGRAARGVVFGIIGWFLIQAALRHDPREAQGFATALRTLRDQEYGPYLLAIVAVGLIAYGLFEIAEARYRVIRPR